MSKTTCTYDTNCTIAANSFTYYGYEFVSWTKDSTTGTSYTAGSTVKNLATSGNINMYAKWKERENQFGKDSWSTIAANVKSGNTSKYNVGDTKTVDLGTFGTHTVRIANMSACTNGETSETACGFVVEFADIITEHKMNSSKVTNVGGWKDSEMRTYINRTIYNALPSDLQNVITTTKVISGHGNTTGETNFETQDKLYLLSAHEVWEDGTSNQISSYDTSYNNTKQLDYYKNQGVTTGSYSGAKKQYNGSNSYWWLRSTNSGNAYNFLHVSKYGSWSSDISARGDGVSPAFRLEGPWIPTYYAFGTPTTASATDYRTLGKKVFAGLGTDNTKGVCINDNGLFCIKPNDYDNSVLALKNHFGESDCSAYGSNFACGSYPLNCTVASDSDGVRCTDQSTHETCIVRSAGAVDCS